MRVLSLFSGIGGLELGLEWAGMTTVGQCEFDRYCRKVLEKHWPGMPRWIDVREVTGENVKERCGHVDLVCGGFPCQDISVAGKGVGLSGERSGLYWEMWRVIKEVRPDWVLAENVPALRTRGADDVIASLEGLGYTVWPIVVGAWAVGAPHKRDRVWIVANSPRSVRCAGTGLRINSEPSGRRQLAGCGCNVADSQSTRLEGHRAIAGQSPFAQSGHDGPSCPSRRVVSDADSDAERWATKSRSKRGQWLSEPNVGGSPDGFPVWLERCVGKGMSYAESLRATETLRQLWSNHVSQALRRCIGGLERISQAEVLFSFVRQYENGINEARLLMEGKEVPEIWLRGLRKLAISRSPSYRPRHLEQRPGEHSNSMQLVSRLLAHTGETHWAGGGWEDAIPRVASGVVARVDRLRCLGNAVVPEVAEQIGRLILEIA